MVSVPRTLHLIAITLWVGGIAFFAFVVAPVAFKNLPSAHEAGIVVRGSILILHRIGFVCATISLASLFFLRTRIKRANLLAQAVLVALMFAFTFLSQSQILPRMEEDRIAAKGSIEEAPRDNPARIHFERLHVLSERVEGAILLAGFAVIILMANDRQSTARSA